MRSVVLAAAAGALLAGGANAEIFKCVGANGEVRFTSSAAQCPNAQPHQPSEEAVQRVEKEQPLASARPGAGSARRRPAGPAAAAAAAADESAGSEALWRGKRAQAEQQLREIEARLDHVQKAVRWCNDGNLLWVEDDRTGIRKDVPCGEVDGMKAALDDERERIERYLAEGLEEECRRAGCLPGWVR